MTLYGLCNWDDDVYFESSIRLTCCGCCMQDDIYLDSEKREKEEEEHMEYEKYGVYLDIPVGIKKIHTNFKAKTSPKIRSRFIKSNAQNKIRDGYSMLNSMRKRKSYKINLMDLY